MFKRLQPVVDRPDYCHAERRFDVVIHLLGLAAIAVVVPVMFVIVISRVVTTGDIRFLAAIVYALGLAAMIGASAWFNMAQGHRWRPILQRLDHSAIYLKIAGTYTPFTLIPGTGLWMTGLLWVAACLGVVLKCFPLDRFRWLALSLYVGMGWAGVAIVPQLYATLPGTVLALIFAGGIVYTAGIIFYLWTRLRFHYAVWHVFVLVASGLLYAAVLQVVLA